MCILSREILAVENLKLSKSVTHFKILISIISLHSFYNVNISSVTHLHDVQVLKNIC